MREIGASRRFLLVTILFVTAGILPLAKAAPVRVNDPFSVTATLTCGSCGITFAPITVTDNNYVPPYGGNGDFDTAWDRLQFFFYGGSTGTSGTAQSPDGDGANWLPYLKLTSPPWSPVTNPYWDPGPPYDAGMWIVGDAGDVVNLEIQDSYPGLFVNQPVLQVIRAGGYFYFPSAQIGSIELTSTAKLPLPDPIGITATYKNTSGAPLVVPFGPVRSSVEGAVSSPVPVDWFVTATFQVDGAIFLPNSAELEVVPEPSSLLLLGTALLGLGGAAKRKFLL